MQLNLCTVTCWIIWSDVVCACGPSSTKNHYPPEEPLPRIVQYDDDDIDFSFELQLYNVPPNAKYYEICIQTDQSGGKWRSYLKGPMDTSGHSSIKFHLILEKYYKEVSFDVSLKENNLADDRLGNQIFLKLIYRQTRLRRSKDHQRRPLALDWKNKPKATLPAGDAGVVPSQIRISPVTFKETDNPVIRFACKAECRSDEVLVWFQDKGSREPIPMMMNQTLTKLNPKTNKFMMEVHLTKTLDDDDRNSYIFCGKRVITRNGVGRLDLALAETHAKVATSEQIVLSFTKTIGTSKPVVKVEPEGVLSFQPNTTVEIQCSSSLVDGRSLLWYEGDPNSTPQRLQPNQKFINDEMRNTLILHVNESFDGKKYYCVQEYPFFYKTNTGKVFFPYGEIARSEEITLRNAVFENSKASGWLSSRGHQLAIAGACVAGTLILLLAGLLVSRRPCRRRPAAEEENYVTPQVTYAVLALPETDSKAPKKPDKQNYVEIVGVYKNKSNKR